MLRLILPGIGDDRRIAESGELLISRIEGPRDNIIGLPCKKLSRAIQAAT
jgi:predicted house-cleaning NTP pyrophosphatase (Maf/HAM1 superfamily)